jgi:hypothetical protein
LIAWTFKAEVVNLPNDLCGGITDSLLAISRVRVSSIMPSIFNALEGLPVGSMK